MNPRRGINEEWKLENRSISHGQEDFWRVRSAFGWLLFSLGGRGIEGFVHLV